MHPSTSRTDSTSTNATPKARVVLSLGHATDQNLRVLAALRRVSKSRIVEELVERLVREEQASQPVDGKAA